MSDELRERFEGLTFRDVTRFVTDGREEDLQLEFKTVSNSAMRDANDRRNLAKALSGFANSSGGIVVWGVNARRDDEGIDRAFEIQEVSELDRFLGRLNELTGMAVIPPVHGARHRALSGSNSQSGVAVTLVPESLSGPHMAKAREDRYYKRSGDSFYRMEHHDLLDMFGRRARPDLVLSVSVARSLTVRGGGGTRYEGRAVVGIMNVGRGLARAPYLALTVEPPYVWDGAGVRGSRGAGLPELPHGGRRNHRTFGASMGTVIHPDTLREVCAIKIEDPSQETDPEDLILRFAVTAEGIRKKEHTMTIPGHDVKRAILDADIIVRV